MRLTNSEILVSTSETSVEVHREVKQGRLRKLASRLYTANMGDSPEDIVRRNCWEIVAGYYPSAIIADRTAFELQRAADDSICIIADGKQEQILPGLIIRPRLGIGPQQDDALFVHGLFLSSRARAFLENTRPSRRRGDRVPRSLSSHELEERLEKLISREGEDAVNSLRDRINSLAPILGLEEGGTFLTKKIGALLGTQEGSLESSIGKARRDGRPYDSHRIELFEILHSSLRTWSHATHQLPSRTSQERAVFAFVEAYFSNFIEGTEFAVDEARDIIFNNKIPENRPEDAHDIRGTFKLALGQDGWEPRKASSDEFIKYLRLCHKQIMDARREKNPGAFKTVSNRAGATEFVEPRLVKGTLLKGLELLKSLETPFHRAVFTMFLISEVHPFDDGNGRTARILMNAELSSGGEERIIIPTVHRANYLAALKALTHNSNPMPLIRTLDFAWKWSASLNFDNFDTAIRQLKDSNAFEEEDGYGTRLQIPNRIAKESIQ